VKLLYMRVKSLYMRPSEETSDDEWQDSFGICKASRALLMQQQDVEDDIFETECI